MPVDIRATVTCSLGTLISGSISDDYLQGSGLIKTRGSVELSGTLTPAIGTIVTFSYTKGGVTRSIPRKLRVLSSFADPYRRTTQVELGCKLTYLSDLTDPIDWSVFDDTANSGYNADDAKAIPLPIRASSVMAKCLTELGITASSSPLTNIFSVGEFDFSPGYVQILSDLLVSESYFGYLDTSEVLQIVNLTDDLATGPVYTASEIIDLGPINSGQLPAEAVTVSYSTLRLKPPVPPEQRETINWESSKSVNGPVTYYIGDRVYTGMETTTTTVQYRTINDRDVPVLRTTEETGSTAKVAGSIGTSYVNNNITFGATNTTLRREVEQNFYDKNGDVISTEITVLENPIAFYGSLSLPYAFSSGVPAPANSFVTFPSGGFIERERTRTEYRRAGQVQQETTTTYIAWILSIPGQQAIAENRDTFTDATQVANFVSSAVTSGMTLDRSVTTINTRSTTNGRPKGVLAAGTSKDSPSAFSAGNTTARTDRLGRLESKASLELAVGSAAAQRRIELSMPYAPDDRFDGPSGGPFTLVNSDAAAKANRYGRVQNRLLLGNRSGMNIQLAPERLPAAPFAPMYVQANGLTAQYRANGNQWAFSAEGIACSTDALFWNATGGTGTFWFPVAPGVTTLPTTPPVVDGTITPTTLVLPYNETASYRGAVRTKLKLTKFEYPLQVQTVVPPVSIKTKLLAFKYFESADAGDFILDGPAQLLSAFYGIQVNKGEFVLTGTAVTLDE